MKNRKFYYVLFFAFALVFTSCSSYETVSKVSKNKKSSPKWVYNKKSKSASGNSATKNNKSVALKSNKNNSSKSSDVKIVLKEAEKYKGTPYKFGGVASSGIDCSGLVYVSFQKINKSLPRRSVDMSKEGNSVNRSGIKEGDLLFFATGGGGVNHVGIVHDITDSGEIHFIHASTSKGVMISSLEENYWKGKFIEARRVL